MLKACQYCGRIHDKKFDCSAKLKTLRERDEIQRGREGEIRSFRSSAAWRRKAAAIRRRDKGLCLICKDELDRLGVKSGSLFGAEVHHITPLVKDFEQRLDDDNLITLCRTHHEEAEAGEYKPDYLRGLARASGEG